MPEESFEKQAVKTLLQDRGAAVVLCVIELTMAEMLTGVSRLILLPTYADTAGTGITMPLENINIVCITMPPLLWKAAWNQ